MQHTGTTQTTYHTLVITDEERKDILADLEKSTLAGLTAGTRELLRTLRQMDMSDAGEGPRVVN